ncbi:Cell division protein kinase 9 [Zootermopsis nevadensis]|uniref:Cell division protein kinase 9 n=1 Tax=Zootermopsis nevadensis TaxID=136037 RepID=A0A067RGQ3_ZOONE|nr:Cell division protein kinase 9 [Zootermopsis nevadensis]
MLSFLGHFGKSIHFPAFHYETTEHHLPILARILNEAALGECWDTGNDPFFKCLSTAGHNFLLARSIDILVGLLGRGIGRSQGLYLYTGQDSTTQKNADRHLWLEWDSNPRSQRPSGTRPTPQPTRPLQTLLHQLHQHQLDDDGAVACVRAYEVVQGTRTCFAYVAPAFWIDHKALGQSRKSHDLKQNLNHSVCLDPIQVKERLKPYVKDPYACDLLDKLLVLDPSKRYDSDSALNHDFFWTDPMRSNLTQLNILFCCSKYQQDHTQHFLNIIQAKQNPGDCQLTPY